MNVITSTIKWILITLWTILSITSSFIFASLLFKPSVAIWMARKIWAPILLFILGVKVKVEKTTPLDAIPTAIFVSNHQSYLDIPTIIKNINRNLYFIVKQEIKKIPFLGQYVSFTGMVFVDRSHPKKAKESLIKAAEIVKNGKNIIAFPAGTRSKNDSVGKFKKGVFILAIQAQVPIVPVAVSGSAYVMPIKSLIIKRAPIKVKIGAPISTKGLTLENVKELIEKTENEVKSLKSSID